MALEPIDSRLVGVGALLKQQRLAVPAYQRPYTWEVEHVKELFADIIDAKLKNSEQYFLGTVVLTNKDNSVKNIIDGQQRIVTTTILISAIRNYFQNTGDVARATKLTEDYISNADLRTMNSSPRVRILPDDQKFYNEYIVQIPNIGQRAPRNLPDPQKRLFSAIREAKDAIENFTNKSRNPKNDLFNLVEFIETKVVLVYLDVGSESNAYVIFEVLNDRGLDLTVADLLKNYVFSLSGPEDLASHQSAWKEITTLISLSNGEGDIKNFIRHDWISRNGLVRGKNLYDDVKKIVNDATSVSEYVENLKISARLYSAFSNYNSDIWREYSEDVRRYLLLFDIANITQVRPLLLSVFKNFNKSEINRTIPMLASWSVRFLICGSGGSGFLEENYAQRAKDVFDKKVNNARELYEAFDILPPDAKFEKDFAIYSTNKHRLARWILAELEVERSANRQKITNTDTSQVNLEHVLPQNPDKSWSIGSATAKNLVSRLGNLVLLEASVNSHLGNSSFGIKKSYFSKSEFVLTKDVSEESHWDETTIDNRQKIMSKIAVKKWKNKP